MRRAFPVVYTRDVRASAEFYEGLLGFARQYQFPPDSEDPGYVGLRRDESELGIVHESSPRDLIGMSMGDSVRAVRLRLQRGRERGKNARRFGNDSSRA